MKKFLSIMVALASIGLWSTTATAAKARQTRFEVISHTGGVQTVFDTQTNLEWEIKVNCGGMSLTNPRCVENTYTWTANLAFDASGTLFTNFLAMLNNSTGSLSDAEFNMTTPGCYAGHCDWSVPDMDQLKTILAPCPNAPDPCIDPIFGPTQADSHMTSTSFIVTVCGITGCGPFPADATVINFSNGTLGHTSKSNSGYVRAVRAVR